MKFPSQVGRCFSRLPPSLLLATALACLLSAPLAAEGAERNDFEDESYEPSRVLEALAEAWPDRIARPERRGEEWVVKLDDTWYRWAGGRLLPETFRGDEKAWAPWSFYGYPEVLPPVTKLGDAAKESLGALLAERDKKPPRRYPAFYDQLWTSRTEREAWDRTKTILFLGHELLINCDLLEEVAAVEREVREAAARIPAVASWVRTIGSVEGYAWRPVQGTSSRSLHSYGAAIDIVPRSARSLAWYWLDARNSGLAWYELPYSRRISVPPEIVSIFERYGFVWGGKWYYWDFVHFEYRPEILILNGFRPGSQAPVR